MNKLNRFQQLIVALGFVVLAGSTDLLVQTAVADDGVVCAAIYPCNSDGTVFAPYNQGACKDYYSKMCLSNRFNREMASCSGEFERSENENTKLKNQIKRLQRQIRDLRIKH